MHNVVWHTNRIRFLFSKCLMCTLSSTADVLTNDLHVKNDSNAENPLENLDKKIMVGHHSHLSKELSTSFRKLLLSPRHWNNSENLITEKSKISEMRNINTCNNYVTEIYERIMPKTLEEIDIIKNHPLIMPHSPYSLKIVILGTPNSGKSTLANAILNWKVFSVSSKVHTTQNKALAFLVEQNTQISVCDTPGIISTDEYRKYKLSYSTLKDAERSVDQSDVICVIYDVSSKYASNGLDPYIVQLLKCHPDKKSILILNKIDKIRNKRMLLEITAKLTEKVVQKTEKHKIKHASKHKKHSVELYLKEKLKEQSLNTVQEENEEIIDNSSDENLRSWNNFNNVFMISAIQGEGINELKKYLISYAEPKLWSFPAQLITEENPMILAKQVIKAKLLDHLPYEIPYLLKPDVCHWHVNNTDTLDVIMSIRCPLRIGKIIIGPSGMKIKKIAQESQQNLMDLFHTEVYLRLAVETDRKLKLH